MHRQLPARAQRGAMRVHQQRTARGRSARCWGGPQKGSRDVYLTEEKLAPLVARYGRPRVVSTREHISSSEMDMVLASRRDGRAHDVTCFILDDRGRVAVIRKHFHPPGVWRAPSGGIHAGEDPEEGISREMREETGLAVRPTRYLVRIEATFVSEEGDDRREQAWVSHVFAARPASPGRAGTALNPQGTEAAEIALDPQDREEIACARWVTIDELQGHIRQALLDTGRGLFRYRVLLTDLAVAALTEVGLQRGVDSPASSTSRKDEPRI